MTSTSYPRLRIPTSLPPDPKVFILGVWVPPVNVLRLWKLVIFDGPIPILENPSHALQWCVGAKVFGIIGLGIKVNFWSVFRQYRITGQTFGSTLPEHHFLKIHGVGNVNVTTATTALAGAPLWRQLLFCSGFIIPNIALANFTSTIGALPFIPIWEATWQPWLHLLIFRYFSFHSGT